MAERKWSGSGAQEQSQEQQEPDVEIRSRPRDAASRDKPEQGLEEGVQSCGAEDKNARSCVARWI